MNRIVIGTDGSPGAQGAVCEGLELARLLDAPVTVVSVRRPIPSFGDPQYQRKVNVQLQQAYAALEAAVTEAERVGVKADTESPWGDVVSQILRTAHQRQADLIVVGSGRGGTMLGPVSRALVERSRTPVVLVNDRVDRQAHARRTDALARSA